MGGRGAGHYWQQTKDFLDGESKGKGEIKPIDISNLKYNNLQWFENRLRNLKHEEMYIFDENGAVVKGYKGDKGSVTFPNEIIDGKEYNMVTVTHGHPKSFAEFGGTFSFADVANFLNSNWKEHRAVASGHGEGNYIMRAKTGKNGRLIGQRKGLRSQINHDYPKLMSDYENIYKTTFNDTLKATNGNVKEAQHVSRQKAVGMLNKYWRETLPKYNFEYITTKKSDYNYNRPVKLPYTLTPEMEKARIKSEKEIEKIKGENK